MFILNIVVSGGIDFLNWYQGVNYMLECCKLAWVLQSWPKLMMHYFEVGNHYLVFWAHSPSKLKQHCVGGGVGEVDRQPRCWQKFKVSWDFGSELFVYHFMHVFRLTSYIFFFYSSLQRHWIVLDGKGNFITQRKDPKLALVVPHFEDGKYLCLDAPGMETLKLDIQLRADQREYKRIMWAIVS